MRSITLALCAITLSSSLVTAFAAPKKAAAPQSPCGIKFLPVAVGNTWTYKNVPAPIALPPAEEKQAPLPAKQVSVAITAVTAQGPDTMVTFEETVDGRKLTTSMKCSAGKIEFSPDAFFFNAEPGGYLGLELSNLERKGSTWTLTNGTIGEAPWQESFVAKWKRLPTKGTNASVNAGKVEVERVFTPAEPENVATPNGPVLAEKLAIAVTGRITVDGSAADVKPYELKAGIINTLWFADNIGVAQVLNAYAHMYVLSEVKLTSATDAAKPGAAKAGAKPAGK